jgi:hypothetical protein
MSRFGILSAVVVATLSTQAHAVGSLADVSIYDRNEGRELPIYFHHGKYYVAGKPGNEYQITLRSQSQRDVLGVVSVDGVNVVSGQTATPHQSGYMLTPWQQTDITGWRKSTDRVARFYFTELPDSYAARTDRPDDVGVIGVAIFRSKQYDPPSRDYDYRPYDNDGAREDSRRYSAPDSKAQSQSAPGNESYRSRVPQPDDKLGTGHGREERSKVRQVEFERESSRPNEVITIYYDSHRNLVAAGIIPKKRYAHRRDEPQPFPGQFVPDPWRRW